MRKDNSDRIEKWAATSLTTALTLLLTLTLCGPAVAQSTAFNANGAFASASDCSVSQTSVECITIPFVSRGSTAAGQTATFLSYDFHTSDLSGLSFQDILGFGQIPNSAFQVHGQTDSLNVDTSKLSPDVFSQEVCTFDPNTGETCIPFSGGVVTGTWTAIPSLMTSQFSGTGRSTFPDVIFIFTGTEESQTALANVSGFGVALANMTGSVGTNHQTTISVQVRH